MADPTITDRTTLLARRLRVDVNTAWPEQGEDAEWVQLIGITELTPVVSEPNLEDDGAYEDDGWGSQEKTGQSWQLEATVMLRESAGQIAEVHNYLRRASIAFGSASRAHVRWYDRDGQPEAYMGVGVVQWARANSGLTDLDAATITVHGRGRLHEIDNPAADNGDDDQGGEG